MAKAKKSTGYYQVGQVKNVTKTPTGFSSTTSPVLKKALVFKPAKKKPAKFVAKKKPTPRKRSSK